MKIVVLDGYTLNPGDISWQELAALGELTVYDRTSPTDVAARIENADIVFTNKTPLTAQTIQNASALKYIGVLATGYNIVDVSAAKERNIPVCNIPTYGTMAVAQFTIALLLEICHHIGSHSESVHLGEWTSSTDWCYWKYPLVELCDKTLGIIGFGRIGIAVAKIAAALGMKILAFDAFETDEGKKHATYVPLHTLLAESDVVSLHCPLFPETEGIICKENIDKMKDGAILINPARGPLIVEKDLAHALASGKLAGAAVDVVSTEPIKADNPLLGAKNCIITPHIAWAPKESRMRLMGIAVDNLRAFLASAPQNNVWESC